MSYQGTMFLVRQGCPYTPSYYRGTNTLDRDTRQQYRDCVKTASPSQVGQKYSSSICHIWHKI